MNLKQLEYFVSVAELGSSLPLRELPNYALVLPEQAHTFRRLLESQATLAGIKFDIAWEVSSIPSIIDMVCTGYGHAVLAASAVAASGRETAAQLVALAKQVVAIPAMPRAPRKSDSRSVR